MKPIAFIDVETESKSRKILDIGAINGNGHSFHSNSITEFINFLKGASFICGHNIIQHDLKYIQPAVAEAGMSLNNVIDTLHLSPLLFPAKPYHALLKDDKLQTDDLNNPLNDSIKARDLFFAEIAAFQQVDDEVKKIFYLLLKDKLAFQSFFKFVDYSCNDTNLSELIFSKFESQICSQADLEKIIPTQSIELAYCLALINAQCRYSITPPWVLKNYPEVERTMFLLRNKPCLTGCAHCHQALNIHTGLKKYFAFDSFRKYGGEPLQENAAKAAIDNKSLLAVFPTGGGKSITFQLPALMGGVNVKGLTVVISPLQSLMKDQVDNLEKIGITDAVTINGLLDPIERQKSLERVEDGSASILYISPESLRSRTIERLLLGRNVIRFVIDEAHCFSSWGQDFRVDYLYIGDFIKSFQETKKLEEKIPVSCFTATAKQKVIEDIYTYFRTKLSLELEIFTSKASRTNLQYKVFEKGNDEEKYNAARDLIEGKKCPTIIYVSRTKNAYSLAERLTKDGFNARPYHGKMEVKEKTENQNNFIAGEVQIMVATSAFGMGVDKKDVGLVIHYEISDSLENYIQEAGRAGRDESIVADCFILFNEDDLSKHFILLNQTKLNINEIKQIWSAIKFITKFRNKVSNSALEIARKAGWDDNVYEIETRVTTAIAALEDAGYLKRSQNMPRIFANSILSKTAQEAVEKINTSTKFVNDQQKTNAIRIIKKLISSKSRKYTSDDSGESRIDYISDVLGIVKEEVINIVNLLRAEKILADARDLQAFIKRGENKNRSLSIIGVYSQIEYFLLSIFEEQEETYNLKELNEQLEKNGQKDITPGKIKTIINFWAIENWIKRHNQNFSKNHIVVVSNHSREKLKEKLNRRLELSRFIVDFLYNKSNSTINNADIDKPEVLVEFSILELMDAFKSNNQLFSWEATIDDIEDTLFYLSRIEAIKIEGGFLVTYNKLTIDRLEQDNRIQYKADDYQALSQFYENKVQQIHIVGEYAKKMIDDYKGALNFVDDYFQLNQISFLNKYFPGSRQQEIKKNITPAKYRQLFESLSEKQRQIIDDKNSKYMVVAAGPGSGKTKVLVHKLASLLLMEDVKHEQLLMVTFSRAAATEFKKRLINLIGNAANFIDIKTFHSYCFDLLGKVGSIEKSSSILQAAIDKIQKEEVEINRITKTVLVIDEAQDMDKDEFELINILMQKNPDMRVIAVGDDDQNIYSFRGADSKYLQQFITEKQATKYELITNYRSKANLVAFSNQFVSAIHNRLKATSIVADNPSNGKITIVHYKNNHLITPFTQYILSEALKGTTCVLTHTNEEAFQIAGLLTKNGLPAKLIQNNDGFSLYDLLEIRFFLNELRLDNEVYIIDEEVWIQAKKTTANHFKQRRRLEICNNIISDFEETNPKRKYKSDLEVFIRESKLEDFYSEKGETVFVSTIHKAKGREFDNVFLLLENFDVTNENKKRLLYVAMTRAKQNLIIHYNGKYLDNISTEELVRVENPNTFQPSRDLALQLSHKEIWLGYFASIQHRVNHLMSGDELGMSNEGCTNKKGELVLKFSKKFLEKLAEINSNGYRSTSAKVNFIVYWTNDDTGQELKIVLPELYFEK